MDEFELGFVIGMIEGEGSICLLRKKTGLQPVISMSSKDKVLLERVRDIIGYGRIYPMKSRYWTYQICGHKNIVKVLGWLIPFLITKKKRGILLKAYCESRMERNKRWSGKDIHKHGGRGPPYSESDYKFVELIRNGKDKA